MNTRLIEYVIAIAEEQSISNAAKRLYISQSTLSQSLINLERELGISLFLREQHKLILTSAGECYLQGAYKMLKVKKQTYSAISKLITTVDTHCRVGISSTEGMRRFLITSGVLQKQYLNVELYAVEEHADSLYQKLKAQKLDIIIIASFESSNTEFPCHVFRKEEILLAIPTSKKEEIIAEYGQINWEKVNETGFIVSPIGTTMRKIHNKVLSNKNINISIKRETNNIQYTLQMISDGISCSLLPSGLIVEKNNVTYIPLNEYRYQMVLYRPEHKKNKMIMDFVRMLERVNLSQQ